MLSIRPAIPNDAPLLKSLIHELAEFERLDARITEQDLLRDGFGPQPKFRVLLAEWDAQPAGYALFFPTTLPSTAPLYFWKTFTFAPSFAAKI